MRLTNTKVVACRPGKMSILWVKILQSVPGKIVKNCLDQTVKLYWLSAWPPYKTLCHIDVFYSGQGCWNYTVHNFQMHSSPYSMLLWAPKGIYFNINILFWHILDQMPPMLSTRRPRKKFLLLPIIVSVGWLVFWDTWYLA